MTRFALFILALSVTARAQDPDLAPTESSVAHGAQPSPNSTTYALSPAKSDLYVVIRNDPSASLSRLGHDHVIYASRFDGTVTWPSQPGGQCSVEIKVPVMGLTVDPPGLRSRARLDDNTIDESDKQKLSKNMWGNSQLNAAAFPAVTFRSESCPGGTGRVKVDGTMTIRGVSRPVSVMMDVTADTTAFHASGRLEATHAAFGFKPFSASFLGPRNHETLAFTISVAGAPR